MEDTLTVIIPVYNGMPYLEEAVDSVLKQTYTDFQLLIVDDGSTDSSAAYLDSLSDPRIAVRHQRNMGEVATCNQAVESVDSDFVAFLHQDDIAMPSRLQKQRDFLVSHPDYACIVSNFVRFSGTRSLGSYWTSATGDVSDYDCGRFGSNIPSTLCVRRANWLELGGFRSSLRMGGDYDFFLRCEERFKMAMFHEPLVMYRIHAKQTTTRKFPELQIRSQYVAAIAALRRAGEPEIPFDEFRQSRISASPFINWLRKRNKSGEFRFRKAGIEFREGKVVAGTYDLLVAIFLAPQHVFSRLMTRLLMLPGELKTGRINIRKDRVLK